MIWNDPICQYKEHPGFSYSFGNFWKKFVGILTQDPV